MLTCSRPCVWCALGQASEGDTWAERASALVFLQYFWFRHAFLLGPAGTAAVLEAVRVRLADAKLEVRELAALTLSGSAGRYQHRSRDSNRERWARRGARVVCR